MVLATDWVGPRSGSTVQTLADSIGVDGNVSAEVDGADVYRAQRHLLQLSKAHGANARTNITVASSVFLKPYDVERLANCEV